jgi:hypothetical protein
MPNQPAPQNQIVTAKNNRYLLNAIVFGPLRPDRELHQLTQRALKSYSEDDEFYTEITLREVRQPGSMNVEFYVTAASPNAADRAGIFYLGQLCDLMSAVTREPLKFALPGEDAQQERVRINRTSTHTDRILTLKEWEWIIASIVNLRMKHPRFLAAASWYRKGLCGIDPLEVVCCFWRVVERLALSYADKTNFAKEDVGRAKPCVQQLARDLKIEAVAGGFLGDDSAIKKVMTLRNDVSHGNEPITPQLIEEAAALITPLEEAAYRTLDAVRTTKM